MISPVSFSGTYKVSNDRPNTIDDFSKFHNYAESRADKKGVYTFSRNTFNSKIPYSYRVEQTFIVPDSMNNAVEAFCAGNGIQYKKLETKNLLNPQTIKFRVQDAPQGYVKVEVDAKKLSKLLENQNGNIEHCRKDYNNFYKKNINFMLRSGDNFPATTLYISNPYSDTGALIDYIDRYGANRLNKNELSIDFVERTLGQDHCVYFALQNLGLKKIPVYVDSQTYLIGNKLGLF